MYLYTTSGTMDFMKSLKEKHRSENIILMNGEGTTLLLHETEGKSVFQTPRKFEVISSSGTLSDEGYFAFNNIPVTDEGSPIFEHQFKTRIGLIDSEQGFVASRLLRPQGSNTYAILTQWEDASYYLRFKNTSAFSKAQAKDENEIGIEKKPHIFSSASYVTTYKTPKDEEKA
ncbi:antibiotic biosynthesis monooxygenase family protein [Sporosarcina siberiensis]|uniref:Antibiotic biosynthesis monooxygenase family protein n=1 Tax=Sporosarcina siberiensis TaxID=1365606 RepID=A0ABW4SBU4_9BACL